MFAAARGFGQVPSQFSGRVSSGLRQRSNHGDEHAGAPAEAPENPVDRPLGDLLGSIRSPGRKLLPCPVGGLVNLGFRSLGGPAARPRELFARCRVGELPGHDSTPNDRPAQAPAQALRATLSAPGHRAALLHRPMTGVYRHVRCPHSAAD